MLLLETEAEDTPIVLLPVFSGSLCFLDLSWGRGYVKCAVIVLINNRSGRNDVALLRPLLFYTVQITPLLDVEVILC